MYVMYMVSEHTFPLLCILLSYMYKHTSGYTHTICEIHTNILLIHSTYILYTYTGMQLIRRNDEISLLNEKVNKSIHASTILYIHYASTLLHTYAILLHIILYSYTHTNMQLWCLVTDYGERTNSWWESI